MKIILNNMPFEAPYAITVTGLIERLNFCQQVLAIIINGKVIPPAQYREQVIMENDRVETLTLLGGG